jgi:hypothetical protein
LIQNGWKFKKTRQTPTMLAPTRLLVLFASLVLLTSANAPLPALDNTLLVMVGGRGREKWANAAAATWLPRFRRVLYATDNDDPHNLAPQLRQAAVNVFPSGRMDDVLVCSQLKMLTVSKTQGYPSARFLSARFCLTPSSGSTTRTTCAQMALAILQQVAHYPCYPVSCR